MDFARVRAGTAEPAYVVFEVGEEPTLVDDDTDVTVQVRRADGTLLVDDDTADVTDDNRYSYQLDAVLLTSRLDVLTLTWTATIGGATWVETTYVEIVSAFYFSLSESRASDKALASSSKYSTEDLAAARDDVESQCEKICGVAWVRRYRRVQLTGYGTCDLLVPDVMPRTVLELSIGGVALSGDELAGLVCDDAGIIRSASRRFPVGVGNIVVAYEHGYDRPPPDVRRAALTHNKHRLFAGASGIADRATTFVSGEGGTFSLATPGRGGSETGIPDVDAVYGRHDHRIGIA